MDRSGRNLQSEKGEGASPLLAACPGRGVAAASACHGDKEYDGGLTGEQAPDSAQ